MGRRTLTATRLAFHQKRARNADHYPPADLLGTDLIDHFESWCESLTADMAKDDKRQRWMKVTEVRRYASRVVVVEAEVGAFGEAGGLVNTTTGEVSGSVTENDAPTGPVRAVLMVPPEGLSAYMFFEESSRGSTRRLLDLFQKYFRESVSAITMDTLTIVEGETWSEEAKLKEVEVRVRQKSPDRADPIAEEPGSISHIARPPRRKRFSNRMYTNLKNDRNLAATVVGIPRLPNQSEVYVTMERDGRTKKFAVEGDPGAPSLRLVLNDADESTIEIKKLVDVCVEQVSDLLEREDALWHPEWNNPERQ